MTKMQRVSAYKFDSNIDGLSTSELFVLMVMRLWVGVNENSKEQGAQWWEGFLAVGIDRQSAAAFDIFMQILFYASKQTLEVGARDCCRLSDDEALMLRFVSSLQHHQYSRALEILEGWLPEDEATLAWEPAMQYMAGLTAAKLVVPLCDVDIVTTKFRTICTNARAGALAQWPDEIHWVH